MGLESGEKTCYFDAFSGVSGDMFVGALVDAGAEWKGVEAALKSLNLGAAFRIEKVKRNGIAASKFSVEAQQQMAHRHLAEIEEIIGHGEFPEPAKTNAIAVFRRLGEAEARSHGTEVERIHFHEVGAIDSISDVVGGCVALDSVGAKDVACSRINVGSGTVQTDHGLLPVPTPATVELLKQHPIYAAGPEAELTTPTGAALVATLATEFGAMPQMRVERQGFGAGDKDFQTQANVLRVIVGARQAALEATTVSVIEANIDDSSPQVLGYAMERLFEAGALDVTLTPIFMKKNRSATLISVIATPELADELVSILFSETTTLGVRVTEAKRRVLSRKMAEVETRYGTVRMKYTEAGSFAPEYEDCRRVAIEKGVPLRTVMAEASQMFRATLKP